MRDDRARLREISVAIGRIKSETETGQEAFREDPKLQVWVLYHLQIVGEACRGLSESFRTRFPDPVWTKATGLRNILVHHYFEIDQDLVWQVVEKDVPLFEVVASLIARRRLSQLKLHVHQPRCASPLQWLF